jgi:MYXO-CTERM domain-containing protein
MKAFHLILMAALFSASAQAGTVLYTDSTAFFSSPTWTGAIAGSAVTENFVASGGLHNFTGNEQFNSRSYTYGSGSQQNTVTFARDMGADIFVDTSNESGGFRSFDSPGSSKYLYVLANSAIYITFSQSISSFAFRLGDFGDANANDWCGLRIDAANTQMGSNNGLIYEPAVNVNRSGGTNIGNSVNLNLSQSYQMDTPNYSSAGSTSITIGDKSWAFLAWTFDSPIDKMTIINASYSDNWGVDTVSFTTVPEPGAALLGVFGMLTLLRRRRP